MTPISLTAYAKRRGVSAVAVSKAVKRGRLRESVVMVDGQPKIHDAEIADREWDANTRQRIDQPVPVPPVAQAPAKQRPRIDRPVPPAPAVQAPEVPDYKVSRARREAAAARREAAQADLAELEVAQRRGELVPVAEARTDVIDKFTVVKTRILGVPSRVAQRLPHVAAEVVPVIDALLREALEELAADDGDDEEYDGEEDVDDEA